MKGEDIYGRNGFQISNFRDPISLSKLTYLVLGTLFVCDVLVFFFRLVEDICISGIARLFILLQNFYFPFRGYQEIG